MSLELSQVKRRVEQMARIIGASRDILPTFGHSEHSGRPHVEVDASGYHYVVAERGNEHQRHTTLDLDELLYDVFQSVTFELACKYEQSHRVYSKDSRRITFQYQEELLSQLTPSWGERRKHEHERILEQHPYDDYASVRATFAVELREQGASSEEAWRVACDKYPLPRESE